MLGIRFFLKVKKMGINKLWKIIKSDKKNVAFIIYIPIILIIVSNLLPKFELPNIKNIEVEKFEQLLKQNGCYVENIDKNNEKKLIVKKDSKCMYNVELIKYYNIKDASKKFHSMESDSGIENYKHITDNYHNFYEYIVEAKDVVILTQNRNYILYSETNINNKEKLFEILYDIGGHFEKKDLITGHSIIIFIMCFILFIDVVYVYIFIYTKILKENIK